MPRTSVSAHRGPTLRCRGWRQETILRLLENNLENGENPGELVVYMSRAKAARDWESYERIVRALTVLDEGETLAIQSGKPIGRFRTHPRAPLVLMANGNVVGRWATDEQFLAYVPFQGLPARIGWLGHEERSRLALLVNDAVAAGRLAGPIAFTRDHLDAGAVANPFRETEKMKDGSNAIADWPLLCAMLACSNGADLVALHANTNKLQSAGQTTVADGSREAAERLRGVLDGDTGLGVLRYADAGYERAREVRDARRLGL